LADFWFSESSRYPFGGRSSRFPIEAMPKSTTERPVEFSMPGDTTTMTPAPWTPATWTPAPQKPNQGDMWTPASKFNNTKKSIWFAKLRHFKYFVEIFSFF
jgi:hypothetical protein